MGHFAPTFDHKMYWFALTSTTPRGEIVFVDGNVWSFALSLLALACSVLAIRAQYLKSPSVLARQLLEQSQELEKRFQSECALFTATRDSWALEFAAIAERCDESLERAESKRRRVAASDSRRSAVNPEPVEMTREQIIETARRRTLGAA